MVKGPRTYNANDVSYIVTAELWKYTSYWTTLRLGLAAPWLEHRTGGAAQSMGLFFLGQVQYNVLSWVVPSHHFPPKFSVKMAIILSTEPNMAR